MPDTFTIAAISDREVLALARDIASDITNTFTTAEVAEHFDVTSKRPLVSVGVRLGYLRKLGMLERQSPGTWYLTPLGERMVKSALTAPQRRALASLHEGGAWAATESLASLLGAAGVTQAAMMRRQWAHGWAQRNHTH